MIIKVLDGGDLHDNFNFKKVKACNIIVSYIVREEVKFYPDKKGAGD